MKLKIETNRHVIITLLTICLFAFCEFSLPANAQMTKKRAEFLNGSTAPNKPIQTPANKQKFPDQYSDLDAQKNAKNNAAEVITPVLENSRQKYLQALILVQKGDTAGSARYFEEAIDALNKIASFPNIEQNEDFNDLAQSIIEDYNANVKNVKYLDENSSFLMLRDKLFQEIDKLPIAKNANSVTTGSPKDTNQKYIFSAPSNLVIEIPDNEIMKKSVMFFNMKNGRSIVKKWFERSGKWFPMFKRIAESEGVPLELVFLAMPESALNPNALSKASAVGLWQFMRSTGKDYGLNINDSYFIDERRDPEKSTRAAMRFLKDLHKELGDWHLALAAYNCGLGGVKKALKKVKKDNPTFWDIRTKLPEETRLYVPAYLATLKVAQNPEAFGLNPKEIKTEPEYKYDVATISEPTSLKACAKAAGVSLEEIKTLNPELLQTITPPDRKSYFLKIPQGMEKQFAVNLRNMSEEDRKPYLTHDALRGETVTQIAKKYNCAIPDLIALNGLSGLKAKISKGDQLRIPVGGEPYAELKAEDFADDEQDSSPNKLTKVQKSEAQKPATNENVVHVVKKDETIYSISQKYGIRATDLRNLNDLAFDDDNIKIGQELIIAKKGAKGQPKASTSDLAVKEKSREINLKELTPVAKEKVSKTKEKSKEKTKDVVENHKVKKGETLATIADDYGVSIEDIKKQNKIKKSVIKEGTVLKIKTTVSSSDLASSKKEKSPKGKLAVHKVTKGENLETIAKKYGVSEDDLKNWNKDQIEGSTIFAGTRLKIYDETTSKGSSSSSKSKNGKKSATYYEIKNGDNLSKIARKYGTTVDALLKANKGLTEKLKLGEKIKISQ